jgi:FkbM family methyltransferase
MKLILKKIKLRNKQFRNHPISKNNRIKALTRYLTFHMLSNIFPNRKFSWIENLKFYARKGDAGIVANVYYGLYEFNESMFLLHFLRDNDTFLDIGANIGHYSLLASGINRCKSYSVEPIPVTYSRLNEQIHLNKLQDKIQTYNIGLGNTCSELYFSNDKNTMNKVVDSTYPNALKIPVQTVDNLFKEIDITLIKIDVEGYEKFVLEGSHETFKNQSIKAVIIEINFSNQFYNIENEQIVNFLKELDFTPFSYNPFSRELTALSSYNKQQFNTIFVRDLNFVRNRLKNSRKIKIWNHAI